MISIIIKKSLLDETEKLNNNYNKNNNKIDIEDINDANVNNHSVYSPIKCKNIISY
jgi:hypothetical protein